MESKTKSHILRELSAAIDQGQNYSLECELKKSDKIIKVQMELKAPETFTDENGVVWVRK